VKKARKTAIYMQELYNHSIQEQWDRKTDCSPKQRVDDFLRTKTPEQIQQVKVYIINILESPPIQHPGESNEQYVLRYEERNKKADNYEKVTHFF